MLTENKLLRVRDICGDRKATPPIAALIPIARSSWWAGVKSGRYPQPVKLGTRTTAWRASDIAALIETGVTEDAA